MSTMGVIKQGALVGTADETLAESDNALAVRGDGDSFVLLYHRYVQQVYRYLYTRTSSHHDAEEATAQVFERAWQAFPRFKPTGAFSGWLFTIVQRVLVDHYRTNSALRAASTPLDDTVRDLKALPEEALIRSEQTRAILRGISALTPEQQDIIYLRFVAELPYASIAVALSKSEAAVKMATYRALETLKRRIDHE